MRALLSGRVARPAAAAILVLSTLTPTLWTSGDATGSSPAQRHSGRTALTVRGILDAVSATSSRNAWAVGSTNRAKTLVLRWDGRSWRRQASPNPAGGGSLTGVAASSARNAWAVGADARGRALILHWNGIHWTKAPTPRPGSSSSLAGVAVVSSKNAWAVGDYFTASSVRTLILHWDGKAWKQVASPAGVLSSVAIVSAHSVWAVGNRFVAARNASKVLVLHWNGASWRRVAIRAPIGNGAGLAGVAVSSARRVWAVGCSGCGIGGAANSLIEGWSGAAWTKFSAARPPGGDLSSVAAASRRRAWAVGGYYAHFGESGSVRTLVQHWNGSSWARASSPSPGTTASLRGVAAISARNAWAVGGYLRSAHSGYRTLILHWNGRTWK